MNSEDFEHSGTPPRPDGMQFVLRGGRRTEPILARTPSRSGAFLATDADLPSGTVLVLEPLGENQERNAGIRLVARVTRSPQGSKPNDPASGTEVHWIRCFSARGETALHDFLSESLDVEARHLEEISRTPIGEAVFDFPQPRPDATPEEPQAPPDPDMETTSTFDMGRYEREVERLSMSARGQIPVDTEVIYSVENSIHRGRVTFLGGSGLLATTEGMSPPRSSLIKIRYPLQGENTEERVILYGLVEQVVEGSSGNPTMFRVNISGIDEFEATGAFRTYMEKIRQEIPSPD